MSPLASPVRPVFRGQERRNGNERFKLSLGHRRRGRLAGLRGDRRHVFAAGAAAADRKGYRLVGGGHLQRHDHRVHRDGVDRKSTRLNSSHVAISYAVFCLKKKKKNVYNIVIEKKKKKKNKKKK